MGDITNVTAGTNLTGGGSSGSVTVNLTASPNITSLNVGGSEVVSSSRALKNIASVDATTVAALGAAGVGGGKNNVVTAVVRESGTFTVPFDCTMMIQIVGGGGTGARLANSQGTNRTVLATGGASGGTALKKVSVTAGQTFTVTIGSGANVSNNGVTNTAENGNTGGTSTVTGTNVNMTANGGGGGTYYNGTYDPTKTLTSAAGGSASGGDTNLTGNTSTAKVGFDAASYTLAAGCSSGASAGRIGAVTKVNTRLTINGGFNQVSYEQAIQYGACSDPSNAQFDYYQTETSRGSSALFSVATAAGSQRENQVRSDQTLINDYGQRVNLWHGAYGGGCGANLISAYAYNLTTNIGSSEYHIKGGDGVCIFTMFLDL